MEELNADLNEGIAETFIPELSFFNLLFKNTNFKILINMIFYP